MQTTLEPADKKGRGGSGGGSGRSGGKGGAAPRGLFEPYKPEQGRWTRMGTLIGAGIMIAWGAYVLYQELQLFQGDTMASLMVTVGAPILFAAGCFYIVWRFTYAVRSTGDFMIATEGEMKKVNWSTKNEVIGSTKVVILFTVLLAMFLFLADLCFQQIFKWLGALRV